MHITQSALAALEYIEGADRREYRHVLETLNQNIGYHLDNGSSKDLPKLVKHLRLQDKDMFFFLREENDKIGIGGVIHIKTVALEENSFSITGLPATTMQKLHDDAEAGDLRIEQVADISLLKGCTIKKAVIEKEEIMFILEGPWLEREPLTDQLQDGAP